MSCYRCGGRGGCRDCGVTDSVTDFLRALFDADGWLAESLTPFTRPMVRALADRGVVALVKTHPETHPNRTAWRLT